MSRSGSRVLTTVAWRSPCQQRRDTEINHSQSKRQIQNEAVREDGHVTDRTIALMLGKSWWPLRGAATSLTAQRDVVSVTKISKQRGTSATHNINTHAPPPQSRILRWLREHRGAVAQFHGDKQGVWLVFNCSDGQPKVEQLGLICASTQPAFGFQDALRDRARFQLS